MPLVSLAQNYHSLNGDEWDRLTGGNPFISHAFLSVLETSQSIGEGTGWQAAPIVLNDDTGALIAAIPAFLKGHSQGEYVFDHAWADAYMRAGGNYYPKLQICAPFTPVTGPRILAQTKDHGRTLIEAVQAVCVNSGLSSAHASFILPEERDIFEDAGWLLRSDIQFHFNNRGYRDFNDFLETLSSRKRRAIRKERLAAQNGVEIRRLSGEEVNESHWDAFWTFYQDTGARKWGTPYLTRAAFSLLGEAMRDRIVLFMAYDEERPIAGALNFIGPDRLYGRYWGCVEERPFLHFELCYYQAIDEGIARGCKVIEAGAQGGHKLSRGYEPVETYSAHFITDENFRDAVAHFLERERDGVTREKNYLASLTPFKKG